MSDPTNEMPQAAPTPRPEAGRDPDPQLAFLEELVEEHATVDGDIIEIDAHTWAIHGFIPVDGEVIMAEYESEEHARIVLDELAAEEHRAADS
jgi:hypothetical protein